MTLSPRTVARFQTDTLSALCASLDDDARPIRYSDGTLGTASATLLRNLSEVWRLRLANKDFLPSEVVDIEISAHSFASLKAVWMQMLQGKGSALWTDVREALRLLIVLDGVLVCPPLVQYLVLSVRANLRTEHCFELCADPSVTAVPQPVLKLVMPTLLEHGPEGVTTNEFLYRELDEARRYVDTKGLVWQEREEAVRSDLHLVLQDDLLAMEPGHLEEEYVRDLTVIRILPFDDEHAVFMYTLDEMTDSWDNGFLACVNVVTHRATGTPIFIGDSYQPVALNGQSLFLTVRDDDERISVYDRDYVRGNAVGLPHQILRPGVNRFLFDMWGLPSTSTLIVEDKYRSSLCIYTPDRPHDEYTEKYRIPLDTGHVLLGCLSLSEPRILLHWGTSSESWLQIYEGGTPIGRQHYMGSIRSGEDRSHRICHRLGRIYALEDYEREREALHIIRMLDPSNLEPLGIVEAFQSDETRQLIGHGPRILVAQSPTHEGIQLEMLDLYANQKLPGALVRSTRSQYHTIAVGAMVVLANKAGRVMVLSRA